MFQLDCVNRLPEQTQRRVYGCAPLALRRVGAKKKFFCWEGEPQQRLQKHDQHVLMYNQPARITTLISASPLLLRSIGALYCTTSRGGAGTQLYRQHTGIACGSKGRQGKTGILDTPAQGESQSSNLTVFFPPLM